MPATTDPLPSWMETGARQAIVRFVEAVTGADREGYVPPDERVTVFDNDGTLWCEKSMPTPGRVEAGPPGPVTPPPGRHHH
jgi:hypothetical protein